MNRQDLRLPTAFLLDAAGRVVKVYRDRVDAARVVARRRRASRRRRPSALVARRAVSRHASTRRCRRAISCPTAASCSIRGSTRPRWSPSSARRRRTRAPRRCTASARCSPKSGEPARARAAFERALALQPDLAEAQQRSRRAARPRAATSTAAIARFRAALAAAPDYPDALNNLGYALLLTGQRRRGPRALREGASRCSRISPRRSTTWGCCSAGPATWTAPSATSATRWRGATTTARRPATWRWCWSPAARPRPRPGCSRGSSTGRRRSRATYITLAKIHFSARPDRRRTCGPRAAAAAQPDAPARARDGAPIPAVTVDESAVGCSTNHATLRTDSTRSTSGWPCGSAYKAHLVLVHKLVTWHRIFSMPREVPCPLIEGSVRCVPASLRG